MEVRLVIFLALTSITILTNALLLFFAYRTFAKFTTDVTRTIHDIQTSKDTRAWLNSMHSAAQQAVSVTETVKQKLTDYEPQLNEVQARFGFTLAKIDTTLDRLEGKVANTATEVQRKIEGPASQVSMFASGIKGVASRFAVDGEEDFE